MKSLQHDKEIVRYALDTSRICGDNFRDSLSEFCQLDLSIEATLTDVIQSYYEAVANNMNVKG